MIGIGGGVGPAAGILLHQAILQHTESKGIDQGHLNVCHFSLSAEIADRARFLRYAAARNANEGSRDNRDVDDADAGKPENPALGMAKVVELMRASANAAESSLVIGIPCITFHVPLIWDEFQRLSRLDTHSNEPVKCLHMLQETARLIKELKPLCRKIGVMSTTGTRQAHVFRELLEPAGYEVLEVPEDVQYELHETILNPRWGIKSCAPIIQPRCEANFHRYARLLISEGAEAIVLGCTEIPFAFAGKTSIDGVLLIDPLTALARALIREVDARRLKPLREQERL